MVFGFFTRTKKVAATPEKQPAADPAVQVLTDFAALSSPMERSVFIAELNSRKLAKQIIQSLDCTQTLSAIAESEGADSGVRDEAKKRLKTLRQAVESDAAVKAVRRLEAIVNETTERAESELWYESFAWLDKTRDQWTVTAVTAMGSPLFPEVEARFKTACAIFSRRLEEQNTIRETREFCEALCIDAKRLAGLKEEALVQAESEFAALTERWTQRGTLPEVFAKRFEARFLLASETYHTALDHYRTLLENRKIHIAAAEEKVSAVESLAAGDPLPSSRVLREIRSDFEQAIKPIRGTDSALRVRFETAMGTIQKKAEAIETALASEREAQKVKAETLCVEMEKFVAEVLSPETLRALQPEVNRLIDDFQSLDPAPAPALTARFHRAEKHFLNERRALFAAEDQERWVHYAAKLKLCELAEQSAAALNEDSIIREIVDRLKSFRTEWKNIGGVPREVNEAVWSRFDAACQTIHNWLAANFAAEDARRAENLALKTRLCEILESLITEVPVQSKAAQQKFEALMAEWKTVGGVPAAERETINSRFKTAMQSYFDAREKLFQEIKERQKEAKLLKEKLIAEAATLPGLVWNEGFRRVQDLRTRWKAAGFAGKTDDEPLWNQFNAAVKGFFDAAAENSEDNLKVKMEICCQIEAVCATDPELFNLKIADDIIKQAVESWRKTGPVPETATTEIVNRFKQALDAWHIRRDSEYNALNAKREDAQRAKEELINQVEEILKSELSDHEKGEKVKALQAEWKTLGHTFREVEESLRNQFSALCNAFFDNRREHFDQLMAERGENLDRKRLVCLKLERLGQTLPTTQPPSDMISLAKELEYILSDNITAVQPESREAVISEAITLQAEWREIGPVPRAESDAIFTRYRRACDAVFGSRNREKIPSSIQKNKLTDVE